MDRAALRVDMSKLVSVYLRRISCRSSRRDTMVADVDEAGNLDSCSASSLLALQP